MKRRLPETSVQPPWAIDYPENRDKRGDPLPYAKFHRGHFTRSYWWDCAECVPMLDGRPRQHYEGWPRYADPKHIYRNPPLPDPRTRGEGWRGFLSDIGLIKGPEPAASGHDGRDRPAERLGTRP